MGHVHALVGLVLPMQQGTLTVMHAAAALVHQRKLFVLTYGPQCSW